MFQEYMDGTQCHICYDYSEFEDLIKFVECGHCFCEVCVNELIFQNKVCCPIDTNECLSVEYNNKSLTIYQYQSEIIINNQKTIQTDIEMFWSKGLENTCEVVNLLNQYMLEIHNVFESWDNRNVRITENEVENLNSFIDKKKELIHEILISNNVSYPKLHVLLDYLVAINEELNSPFHFNIQNYIYLPVVIDLEKPTVSYLNDTKISQMKFIRDTNIIVRQSLRDLKEISFYITKLIISFVGDNVNLYRKIQPSFIETEISKCLICTKFINEEYFAVFSQCEHKICSSCVTRFMITHGSCPFHSTELKYFKMSSASKSKTNQGNCVTKTALQFISSVFAENLSSIIKEMENFTISVIYELKNLIDCNFMDLVSELTNLRWGMKHNVLTKQVAQELFHKIKETLLTIQNNKFINQYSSTLVAYKCYFYSGSTIVPMFSNRFGFTKLQNILSTYQIIFENLFVFANASNNFGTLSKAFYAADSLENFPDMYHMASDFLDNFTALSKYEPVEQTFQNLFSFDSLNETMKEFNDHILFLCQRSIVK